MVQRVKSVALACLLRSLIMHVTYVISTLMENVRISIVSIKANPPPLTLLVSS